jgi:hypothetical protein
LRATNTKNEITPATADELEYSQQEIRNMMKVIIDDQRTENARMNAFEKLLRQIVEWQAKAAQHIEQHEREINASGRRVPWTE